VSAKRVVFGDPNDEKIGSITINDWGTYNVIKPVGGVAKGKQNKNHLEESKTSNKLPLPL
jgi:hypothetical protein